MDVENKVYEENEGLSLYQKFSNGEITADGISEPSRSSKTKLFTKIVNGLKPRAIFAKSFIIDV